MIETMGTAWLAILATIFQTETADSILPSKILTAPELDLKVANNASRDTTQTKTEHAKWWVCYVQLTT